ncbi:MAG: ABC transporter ATP-binding protein [Treponema sp.]|jgi:ABC-type nitrate/sulfonate/bicarbonate transport system ATPase subunit|nr:ABC transporter ATP-binding protein [Treponema sp.]
MERTDQVERKEILRCDNIFKTFTSKTRSLEVIRDISLSVYDKEFVVFFGPAECGKSTLINILSGLDKPSSGQVLQDAVLIDGPGRERGVVYQSISLFPWLSVMGNVEFGPKARGVNKQERRKRAQYFIDLVGLSGFEKAFPNQLSGGMQQRVGIARAYCSEPELLFMDEPFGALDAQTRYMMEQEISRIHLAEKRTVVFVTNNIEEAIYLADRIIVLHNRPASVKKSYEIDMPRPRDYTAPAFLALREEITRMLETAAE